VASAIRLSILIRLLFCAALTACAADPAPPGNNLHALMTDTLNVQMARLNVLSFELHQTQTELDEERSRRREEIAGAAVKLGEAAAGIPAANLPALLGDEDRQLFETLAAALESHAAAIAQSARAGDFAALEEQMRELNDTCISCYSLYRPRR
jgi:cytochrome c556